MASMHFPRNLRPSLVLLGLFILLASCKPNPTAGPAKAKGAHNPLPSIFYKQFKGEVGGDAVTMDLCGFEYRLYGSYAFEKDGILRQASGSWDSTGILWLGQWGPNGDEVYKFLGTFDSDHEISGTFTVNESGAESPFSMVENTEGIVALEHQLTFKRECPDMEDYLEKPSDERSWTDTACSTVHVRTISAKAGGPSENAINQAISEAQHLLAEPKNGAHRSVMAYFDERQAETYTSIESYAVVFYNSNDILSMQIYSSEYNGYGDGYKAHGFLNFDTRTGKRIRWEDMFKPGTMAQLDAIGQAVYENTPDAPYIAENAGGFRLPQHAAITEAGLMFEFRPYTEVRLPTAPQLLVPYAAIEDILQESGPLAEFRKKLNN